MQYNDSCGIMLYCHIELIGTCTRDSIMTMWSVYNCECLFCSL